MYLVFRGTGSICLGASHDPPCDCKCANSPAQRNCVWLLRPCQMLAHIVQVDKSCWRIRIHVCLLSGLSRVCHLCHSRTTGKTIDENGSATGGIYHSFSRRDSAHDLELRACVTRARILLTPRFPYHLVCDLGPRTHPRRL